MNLKSTALLVIINHKTNSDCAWEKKSFFYATRPKQNALVVSCLNQVPSSCHFIQEKLGFTEVYVFMKTFNSEPIFVQLLYDIHTEYEISHYFEHIKKHDHGCT